MRESSHRRRRRGGHGRHSDASRRAGATSCSRRRRTGPSRTSRASRRRRRRAARPIRRRWPCRPTPSRFFTPGRWSPSRSTRPPFTRSLPGRSVDDRTKRSSRRSADDRAGNLSGAGDPGPSRFSRAGGRHASAHRPSRRPAVVSGEAAGRRHLRELYVAGPRVHVGRGGRGRQLFLSPLCGHLDRGCRTRRRLQLCGRRPPIFNQRDDRLLIIGGLQFRRRRRARLMVGAVGLISRRYVDAATIVRAPSGSTFRRVMSSGRGSIGWAPGRRRPLRSAAGRRRSGRARSLPIARPALGGLADLYGALGLSPARQPRGGGDAFVGSVGAHRLRVEPAHLRLPPLFAARRKPDRGRGVLAGRALRGAGRRTTPRRTTSISTCWLSSRRSGAASC